MAIQLKAYGDDEFLAQINIIPLVDVSLVLLIIFIATVNHILTPSINVKLPQSTSSRDLAQMENINITINDVGVIYWEDQVVTLKKLKEGVGLVHSQYPEKGVVVSIDKSTRFQRVVDALDVLGELAITNIDIRTVQD